MSKKNKNAPVIEQEALPEKQTKKKKKKGGVIGRIIRRFFLLLFTLIFLLVADLCLVMNLVFNGPSQAACEVLTMSLTEASATKWVPGVFMGDERVEAIRASVNIELPDEFSGTVEEEGITRAVCDYISGMTDRYAIGLYKQLFIPRVWGQK